MLHKIMIWYFYTFQNDHDDMFMSEAALGITDKMEARPQPPLLIPQAQSRDEGVKFCDSDLFFPFFGWVGWKEC